VPALLRFQLIGSLGEDDFLSVCPWPQSTLGCHPKWRSACATEAACLASGSCSDWDFLSYRVLFTDYDVVGICEEQDTEKATIPCKNQMATPEVCGAPSYLGACGHKGRYIHPATSAEVCKQGSVCVNTVGIPSLVESSAPTRSASSCQTCFGDGWRMQPPYTWTPGVWHHAIPLRTHWRQAAMYQPFEMAPSSFDFMDFANTVQEGVYFLSALEQKTEALCLYSRLPAVLETVACDCGQDVRASSQSCFSGLSAGGTVARVVSIAALGVCSGKAVRLHVPPVTISAGASSIDSGCTTLNIRQLSALWFYETEDERMAAHFLPKRTTKSYEVVRNAAHAVVGKLLGDGVEFSLQDSRAITNVTVCIDTQPFIERASKFDTEDMAYLVGAVENWVLRPHGLVAEASEEQRVCVVVPRLGNDTFFPVQLLGGWKSSSPNEFSTGEQVMLGITAGCYVVVLLLACLTIAFSMAIEKKPWLHSYHYLQVVIIVHSLLRALFFALKAGDALDQDGAEYVLFQLPMCLLFALFTWEVILYSVLALGDIQNAEDALKRCVPIYAATNSVAVAVFVITTILFFTLPADEQETGGLLPSETDHTSQKIVSTVYVCFLLGFFLVVAAAFALFGTLIIRQMKQSSKSGTKNSAKSKILQSVVASGLSFVVLAVYLLVVVLTDTRSVYVGCAILLVAEVPQMCHTMKVFRPESISSVVSLSGPTKTPAT